MEKGNSAHLSFILECYKDRLNNKPGSVRVLHSFSDLLVQLPEHQIKLCIKGHIF